MNFIYAACILYIVLAGLQTWALYRWMKRHEKYVRQLAVNVHQTSNQQYQQTLLIGSLASRVTELEPKEESEV